MMSSGLITHQSMWVFSVEMVYQRNLLLKPLCSNKSYMDENTKTRMSFIRSSLIWVCIVCICHFVRNWLRNLEHLLTAVWQNPFDFFFFFFFVVVVFFL